MSATDSGVAENPSTGGARERHPLVLAGCTPTPLAGYLKALGVLRLVAEQVDEQARGYWRDDQFVLQTALDENGLRRFFLDRYAPTPVIAPWNGGSGFYAGDNQSGIEPITAASSGRFQALQQAIGVARSVLDRRCLETRPDGDEKRALLIELRAELSESALDWLDAAVLLSEEGPKYPPLLGTGGNDGRLDFTNNFLQRLVGLFDPESGLPRDGADRNLDEALFDRATAGIGASAVGQFAPGDAGGPNQSSGFEAKALVNPWDFVLMLEGALLFAAAATRRLESTTSAALSYPFMVRATGAGSGSTAQGDEGNARAEIWMPLWTQPTGIDELKVLLAEGRATLGRRPVVDALDFVRAVSRLGVDRGITGFQRYAFLMRSGKAYFATPLNRVAATRNRSADLIDELDHSRWLDRFRRLARRDGTARVNSLARRIEDAIFAIALEHTHPAQKIQNLLVLLGQAQLYLAASPKAREACPPVPRLSAEWMRVAEKEDSPELAIAAALAGLHALQPKGEKDGVYRVLPMRMHLAPEKSQPFLDWNEGAGHAVTWGAGDLASNLIAAFRRRLLDVERLSLDDKPLFAARTAPLAAVAQWLDGGLDERRIAAQLPGLMLVRMPSRTSRVHATDAPLTAAYRCLKPFFCTDEQLRQSQLMAPDARLPIPGELVRRLAASDLNAQTMRSAMQRLRVAGITLPFESLHIGKLDGRRLLAAMLVPISQHELARLLPRSARRDEYDTTEEESSI